MRAAELPMSPAQRSRTRYWRPSSLSSPSARATMSLEQGRGLVGRGVGEQLHLVELVHPQQPPGVAPGGARLPPEAGGGRGQPQRQVRLVEDVPPPHRGERHLGGRDGPQVVALDVVGVLLELGRWPVDTMVSVSTMVGGRTSSNSSAWRSRANEVRARSNRAPSPRYSGNIDPDSLAPRSMSSRPRSAPISQWGTRWASV